MNPLFRSFNIFHCMLERFQEKKKSIFKYCIIFIFEQFILSHTCDHQFSILKFCRFPYKYNLICQILQFTQSIFKKDSKIKTKLNLKSHISKHPSRGITNLPHYFGVAPSHALFKLPSHRIQCLLSVNADFLGKVSLFELQTPRSGLPNYFFFRFLFLIS